jgi:catechol 2,3-dioxygenase-like lactoylglutathione lyase family enzyme
MPEITKLTPNLIVADVERAVAFYRDVLGFSVQTTVPDHCGHGHEREDTVM